MTITDSGRRSREDLLAAARQEIADGPLPSKTRLAKSLGVHFNTASPILDAISQERAERDVAKRRERRARVAKMGRRKGSGSVVVVRPQPFTFPSPPVVETVTEVPVEPVAASSSEVVVQGPAPVVFTPAASFTAAPYGPVPPPSLVDVPTPVVKAHRKVSTWPALIVAAPAFVAIWAGWVGIGKLTGFGKVNLLPGFWQGWVIDTAITLPVGVEAYAGYAFYVALNLAAPKRARVFAAWTSLSAVALGMAGQTAYHLMTARGMAEAPWQITTVVSCLPVAVFGLAAALVHMVRTGEES
jgi:hypothetical protein